MSRTRKFVSLILLILVLGQVAYIFQQCSSEKSEEANQQDKALADFHLIPHSKYLGDQVCRNCHQQEFADWEGSHHQQAMQQASDSTIKGNFNNAVFTSQGVTTRFNKRDGKFYVNTEGPDGRNQEYEITYTFGTTPLQQYMVEFPNGRKQCLRVAWDDLENKWFDLYPDFKVSTNEWLHWTRGGLNWNTMCADCHSTNLIKDYNDETDVFNTNYALINVNCEACHGPGQEHVQFVNSSQYQPGQPYQGEDHLYLTGGLHPKEQVDQCARCHVRRVQFTPAYNHEGTFMDHYAPEILRDNFYFPDGQIMDEDYVYGSFVQSKMYANNVKCTDCHNAHSLELKAIGNALCNQCHVKDTYDTPEHHFHPVASTGAECINCHMDGRVYMGNDYRRDHSFRVPRPDLSVTYGVPNACTQCHTDEKAEWAAEKVVEWYGPQRRENYADILSFASTRNPESIPEIIEMLRDTVNPAIARATGVWYLGQMADQQAVDAILNALKDSDPIVRYTAVNEMFSLPIEDKARYVGPLLYDSVRTVRVSAYNVLSDAQKASWTTELKQQFEKVAKEFEFALAVRSDFPGGQLEKGQFLDRTGHTHRAEQAYLRAIGMDTLFNPARVNLAHIYNRQGRNEEAIKLFETVIGQEPEYGPAYYSLGLLYAEEQQFPKAIEYLQQAVELMPENLRIHYNLGLAYQNINQPAKAEKAFLNGLRVDRNSPDLLNALSILYIQQEKFELARPYVEQLNQMFPGNQQLQQMLQMIENNKNS
jgi:tetratricopeptide (TPR) repeat protein